MIKINQIHSVLMENLLYQISIILKKEYTVKIILYLNQKIISKKEIYNLF